MRNRADTFHKTIYVVAWAACTIPLSGRTFQDYDEAMKMFKAFLGRPGLRIERMRAVFALDTVLTEKKFQDSQKVT